MEGLRWLGRMTAPKARSYDDAHASLVENGEEEEVEERLLSCVTKNVLQDLSLIFCVAS